MGSQEEGAIMTALFRMSCSQFVCFVIMFVTICSADLVQDQQKQISGQHKPPADEGVFVSPSKEYEELLQKLEQYEKPELPHVAPVNDVYNQLDGSYYEKYNIEKQDDIEEEDDTENQDAPDITPILAIIVPSVVIGLVSLVFNAVNPTSLVADLFGNKKLNSRSDDSFFSFLPKPQVQHNIVIDDLLDMDKILGRFKRTASVDTDTDYMSYLINALEVISNLNGGIQSASCELNRLAINPKFPTLSRIISPFLSNSFDIKFPN